MYFQIENTPEHIRKARRVKNTPKETFEEECPRLVLAPFSRPPQVVFDNVLLGSTCTRNLEVLNPTKQLQQITLGKILPAGLVIHLPGEWLEIEPETCYCLTMAWTPTQPTAIRETIRFTNVNRGRYDIIVVLKCTLNVKGRNSNQPKSFKLSPGKMKKKKTVQKKSPVAIYKKKSEIIYNTATKFQKPVKVQQSTEHIYETYNKENISQNDYSIHSYTSRKCPFDSPTSNDLKFDTSEIFPNMRKAKVYDTFDMPCNPMNNEFEISPNVLKPTNKQNIDTSSIDIFENLHFTPLKTVPIPGKMDKLNKGPKIVFSIHSDSEHDDSFDVKVDKENNTHSIISVSSLQPSNKWLTVNQTDMENQYSETPIIQSKKQPNTSSPKELSSPNFSINTDFSRISDLSFLPQRFSTERKCFPVINETHQILDDKLNSDTYTKDSPNTPMEHNIYQSNMDKPPHYFSKEPKMCRQSLFRDYQHHRQTYDRNYLNNYDNNAWQKDVRTDIRSPPRSITPPLQSIPEESNQLSDTQVFDRTDKQMCTFTINRTFDKTADRCSLSTSTRQTWSKKVLRAETDLWKVPVSKVKKIIKSKSTAKSNHSTAPIISDLTFDKTKSIHHNVTMSSIANIYSQSATVDPFSSATYFYDEEEVHKFENEFKRWLNCILTPPADLDSNIEQKIDVGKAWIENRNKDVPLAPTKEQVSNAYHNSHRLESLRRSARNLLKSPEIAQVFLKLNAQIEKKHIAIRTDRNLHLDVGLQKTIMELILSYNPLWLRIGLEALYGLIIPLKSNSDIEGLTTFVIQKMFKNPLLKNKHSKSSAPNMLLPAYMTAIKKYTLKKFFMLVFFLDQAKQRKLIAHDPCLFCRNSICKESREIIIRFTRDLIAGIGDITKHLRLIGYVVSHKQSYLDEYKYAVHNLALDIRDGVRLTKVMEIILMKNSLLNQLRTPPISRLQKIHNVGVALNALKEADFTIAGDITAVDIADGHREKTLSLLWQIIHVFRAPLFEKAANVIQTWWKKKYEVIVEERKEKERIRLRLDNAVRTIQHWWQQIQYKRQFKKRMQQIIEATVVIQKFCRMWLCRTRLHRMKICVTIIEDWYKSIQMMRDAKQTLQDLREKREEVRCKSATVIQSHVRRWLCIKHYRQTIQKIVTVQRIVRGRLLRKQYLQLHKSAVYVQQKYRSNLLMRLEMQKLNSLKSSVITIQSYYRMAKQRRCFIKLKIAVRVFEERYIALVKMRNDRRLFLELKRSAIAMQSLLRSKKCHLEYQRQRKCIIILQRRLRASLQMKKERAEFLKIRNATIVLQKYLQCYLIMKKARQSFVAQRKAIITIQKYYRSYSHAKSQRLDYLRLRNASIILQTRYKSLLSMRRDRCAYVLLKQSAICIQRQYRALIEMRACRHTYVNLRTTAIMIQRKYRAMLIMRKEKCRYDKIKSSCVKIQTAYRAYSLGKLERQNYLKKKNAALLIQRWFRNRNITKKVQQEYEQCKRACVIIQTHYKALVIARKQRREFLRMQTATISIQRYYRSFVEMKTVRQKYITIKMSTVKIQRFYRSYVETRKQRILYLTMKSAVTCIANYYRRFREYREIRLNYLRLREKVVYIQNKYRCVANMRSERKIYMTLRLATIIIQQRYKALLIMRKQKTAYANIRSAVINVQRRYRAQLLMKKQRINYLLIRKACITIQRHYRTCVEASKQRHMYLKLKQAAIVVQSRYRAQLAMRKERKSYLLKRTAAITIQNRYRARAIMLPVKGKYAKILEACKLIQSVYRAYLAGRHQRAEYLKIITSVKTIQTRFRMIKETNRVRNRFVQLRSFTIMIQRRFRANKIARMIRRNEAANKIQTWYRSIKKRNACRKEFLQLKQRTITLQSIIRMYIQRKRYLTIKRSSITIQRYYRSYKLSVTEKQKYLLVRRAIIIMQSNVRRYIAKKRYQKIRAAILMIQAVYKLKKQRELTRSRREAAATCLQKYIRRHLIYTWYKNYTQKVVYIQKLWRGKLVTRLVRCNFLQKRRLFIKIQAFARGYLIRKQVQLKKEHILKVKQEIIKHWAACRIQALFRGHKARMLTAHDKRVAEMRRRWREGALKSNQETLKERNEDALEVLRNLSDIESVIRAFRSLELLTEVNPMMYHTNAAHIVRRVYGYMSVTNRSISSVDVLKSAAALLVNLTRYKVTGPMIYSRDLIPPILKFMWRFSSSETLLFCILCTYLWLFAKYNGIKEDLTDFLHIPENHKMLVTIKGNIDRMKRMACKTRNKSHTPQPSKIVSHFNYTMNHSVCSSKDSTAYLMPTLEPDYGICKINKPRYFEDPEQAMKCLFHTYNL